MAFGNQVELTYSVSDAKGKVASFNLQLPDTTDIPLLQDDFAQSTAELIDPLIDGKFESASASIGVDLSTATLKTAPIAGCDIEEGGKFTFRSTAGATTLFRLPTFDETFGLENGNVIDVSVTAVSDFVDRIINGDTQGATTVRWSDSRGNNVAQLVRAKDSFKKSRR